MTNQPKKQQLNTPATGQAGDRGRSTFLREYEPLSSSYHQHLNHALLDAASHVMNHPSPLSHPEESRQEFFHSPDGVYNPARPKSFCERWCGHYDCHVEDCKRRIK